MVLWPGSLSNGKLNLYLALNKACALTESALMPRMATLSLSNFFFASRNSDASTIQPEVLALGKNNRTRFPLKSLSETVLFSSDGSWKAGALSPGLSMDPSVDILTGQADWGICVDGAERRHSGRPRPRPVLSLTSKQSGEQFAEDVVDGLRVGLPARGAHHLADKKFKHPFVAGFVLGQVVWILRDDLAGGCL